MAARTAASAVAFGSTVVLVVVGASVVVVVLVDEGEHGSPDACDDGRVYLDEHDDDDARPDDDEHDGRSEGDGRSRCSGGYCPG